MSTKSPPRQTTTIQVFPEDAEELVRRYGSPKRVAFHKLLHEGCSHPDVGRAYTTVLIPAEGDDAIEANHEPRQLAGFRCGKCGRYIVPDPAFMPAE